MRIDWQSLAPNPWFQLCALVAVLSGGTTVYNLTQHPEPIGGGGGGGATPPPSPPPISISTPPPAPVIRAKSSGHWIVDANGAADSDGRDLRTVVANAADGDTVTLRTGSYDGGFNVAKSVHFIGQGANSGAVLIHANLQDTITVSGKSVVFENLTIGLDSPGEQLHTLHCVGTSHVELNHSFIGSKATFGVLMSDNASLDAHDSTFQTAGAGCALDFENNSHGNLLRCGLSSNRWGLEALHSAKVQITSCTFRNNGMPNGDGWIFGVQGGDARIDVSQCQFTGNTGIVNASESGVLSIANSSFKGNGVTGEQGKVSSGLIYVPSGGKATLTNVTFESNKQGIAVENGGELTVSGCHFSNNGIHTDNTNFLYLSNPISVTGKGSSAIVNQGTTISGSTTNGIVVIEGAKLTFDEGSVDDCTNKGIWVGNENGGATADVRHGKFNRSANGIAYFNGSTGSIQDCQFTGNTASGVAFSGAKTKVTVANSVFRGNKNYGLWIGDLADGQATGCTFDGNDRGAQVGVAGAAAEAGTMSLDNCTITNSSICAVVACAKCTLSLRSMRYAGNPNPNVYKERNVTVREDYRNMLVK
jgi:Right handed beta helix region